MQSENLFNPLKAFFPFSIATQGNHLYAFWHHWLCLLVLELYKCYHAVCHPHVCFLSACIMSVQSIVHLYKGKHETNKLTWEKIKRYLFFPKWKGNDPLDKILVICYSLALEELVLGCGSLCWLSSSWAAGRMEPPATLRLGGASD